MNEFLTLTDDAGEDCLVRRENVIAVWEDYTTRGNPPEIIHGARLLLSTGGSLFVRERAAEVAGLLAELP